MAAKTMDESTNTSSPTEGASTTNLSTCPTSEKLDSAPILSRKRRLVAGSITPNACTNCKKARAKLQHSNENLEQQHKVLLQKHARIEQIIEALKDDRRWVMVVDCLRRGDNPRSITQRLRRSTMNTSKNTSKTLLPVAEADLTSEFEVYRRDLLDKLPAGQLSPGGEPTLAQEIMNNWQRACCPGGHGIKTQLDSPSVADKTERLTSVPISSLLNND
ncbi:MAG: hypothetical protein Q9195_005820 [Heterodermia aff. obscurata]